LANEKKGKDPPSKKGKKPVPTEKCHSVGGNGGKEEGAGGGIVATGKKQCLKGGVGASQRKGEIGRTVFQVKVGMWIGRRLGEKR